MIAKALDKAPDRRFGSCRDLVAAAHAVIDAAGPLADTSPPRRAGGSARRDAMTRDAKVLLLVDETASVGEVAAAGADERLAAPFSPLQLQVKLRKLLGAGVIGA